jgi:hypothetical protein
MTLLLSELGDSRGAMTSLGRTDRFDFSNLTALLPQLTTTTVTAVTAIINSR